jgi:hypothetical protein
MNTYSIDTNNTVYVPNTDTATTETTTQTLINTTTTTIDNSNNSLDSANSFMKSVSSQYEMLHNIIDVNKTQIMNDIKQRLLDECKQLTKGDDKKKTIIDVLILLLETNGIDIPNKDLLITFLKEDASNFIDIIIDASKGKINVNKIQRGIINCLFKCLHIR